MATTGANDLVEAELKVRNRQLADYFTADAIIVKAPIRFGLDSLIRKEIEGLYSATESRPASLTVLLETTGGYIEVVERIYNVFRKHYPDRVNFIVPNYAYSAGTVLVLSGDEIYMDYFSILGPEACARASGDAICGGGRCGCVVEQRTNISRRVTRRDRFSPLVDRLSTSLCR